MAWAPAVGAWAMVQGNLHIITAIIPETEADPENEIPASPISAKLDRIDPDSGETTATGIIAPLDVLVAPLAADLPTGREMVSTERLNALGYL